MAKAEAPKRRSEFEIAIICALPIEHDAVESLLDEDYYPSRGFSYGKAAGDPNSYTTGRMGEQPIVLAYMPGKGKVNAAAVAAGLRSSFSGIKLALIVGVCGGAPRDANDRDNDMFLGDLVISTSVLQIDFGRQYQNKSVIKPTAEGNLGPPNLEISAFLEKVSGLLVQPRLREQTSVYMSELHQNGFQQFGYPGAEYDILYSSKHRHKHHMYGFCTTCDSCVSDEDEVCKAALEAPCVQLGCDRVDHVLYRSRTSQARRPSIHFGPVTSRDMVIKSAKHRDDIIREANVLAFEMEGAGTWNIIPTVVVKAVCDYADSHKNKQWQRYSAIVVAACSKALLGEWTRVKKVNENISAEATRVVERSCLRSLSFETMDARRHNIQRALQNTCDWVFDVPQFQEWRSRKKLEEHNGVLWIKAKPGAGKSTLMKHILLYCQSSFHDHLITAYFFNARGITLEKTPFGMLRSLLYQLLSQSPQLLRLFMPHFLDKQKKHSKDDDDLGWEWHFGELRDFLLEIMVHSHVPPTYILVDAIDECEEPEVRQLVALLEETSLAAANSGISLNICLSSRYYPTIDMKKRIQLKLESRYEHDRDIAIYISAKLTANDAKFENQIYEKAQGIFLWAVLVVQIINRAFEEGRIIAMEERLREIPSDLDEVFRLILTSEGNHYKSETLLLLQWVLFTERPLTPYELYLAVLSGTNPMHLASWDSSHTTGAVVTRYITTVSRGLVELRVADKKMKPQVQFIHESVNDFLLRNRRIRLLDSSLGPDIDCQSHARLANYCISYIISMLGLQKCWPASLKINNRSSQEFPFLQYAALHLLRHTSLADPGGISPSRHLQRLQEDRTLFITWQRLFTFNSDPENMTLLYYLALEEDVCLVRSLLLNFNVDINVSGGIYGTALQAAVVHSNHNVIQLLLRNHAAVNDLHGLYGYLLQAAARFGDPKAVQLLLDAGADVNACGGFYGHALQAASARDSPYSKEIVPMLLKAGANVNAVSGFYGTAVQAAAARESDSPEEIIDVLCDAGANIDIWSGEHGNALRAAVLHKRKRNVSVLLERGASIDRHCLTIAAKHEDKSNMQMLQKAKTVRNVGK